MLPQLLLAMYQAFFLTLTLNPSKMAVNSRHFKAYLTHGLSMNESNSLQAQVNTDVKTFQQAVKHFHVMNICVLGSKKVSREKVKDITGSRADQLNVCEVSCCDRKEKNIPCKSSCAQFQVNGFG